MQKADAVRYTRGASTHEQNHRALASAAPGRTRRRSSLFWKKSSGEKLEENLRFLSGLDVCYGPVNTLPEAMADPNVLARGMLVRDESGRRHLAPPIRFRDEPAQPRWREPRLGENNEDLLGS